MISISLERWEWEKLVQHTYSSVIPTDITSKIRAQLSPPKETIVLMVRPGFTEVVEVDSCGKRFSIPIPAAAGYDGPECCMNAIFVRTGKRDSEERAIFQLASS